MHNQQDKSLSFQLPGQEVLPEPGCFSSRDWGWLGFGLDPLSCGWQGHRGAVMGCAGVLWWMPKDAAVGCSGCCRWDTQGCCAGKPSAVVGCVEMLWLDALCEGTIP